jgi:arabinogalactan oligomer/maltooligosaccharide transport system substrate-binding protein
MKLKKAVSLTLCMLLSLSFAGCKGNLPTDPIKEAAASGTTTSIATASSTSAELVPEKDAQLKFRTGGPSDLDFAKVVAENFQKKYGVKVTVEQGGLSDPDKDVLNIPSGKGPDVFMYAHDKAIAAIQGGLIMPLNNTIANNLNQKINSVAMKTVTVSNKVYGVPVSIETYVLFYNKKLVKGTPISTYEQLAKEAKAYNDPAKNKFWFLFDASTGSPMFPMLSTYGFNLFGANGTDDDKPGFDTPEFEKGLEVLKSYHDIVPIKAMDLGNTDFLNTQFKDGNTGYIMSGPWDVKTFRDAGVDIGVVPMPTYDGHQEKSFAFVQNAHVSAYTKYPNAAQLFAQFLVTDESAELLYSKATKITSLKDISKVKGLVQDEVLTDIVKAFDKSVPMPSAKRMSDFWTIITDVGPSVFDGKMTPQQGAKKVQQEWTTALATE